MAAFVVLDEEQLTATDSTAAASAPTNSTAAASAPTTSAAAASALSTRAAAVALDVRRAYRAYDGAYDGDSDDEAAELADDRAKRARTEAAPIGKATQVRLLPRQRTPPSASSQRPTCTATTKIATSSGAAAG